MDYLVATKDTAALQQLQDIFGLGSLDLRDFALTIAFPIKCSPFLQLASPTAFVRRGF